MSNLDYSIALLSVEKSKLDIWLPASDKAKQKANLQEGITRAMRILIEKKKDDEKEERKKKHLADMLIRAQAMKK